MTWLYQSRNVIAKYHDILDDMTLSDDVTGNGSGSYTSSTFTAEEYVLDNIDIVTEMYETGYITNSHVVETFLYGEWETMDVLIRCYLLPQVFSTHGVFNIIYK